MRGMTFILKGIQIYFSLFLRFTAYLFGMIAAMVSGVLSIGLLKMIVRKTRFGGFSYYCWVVGVLTIILSLIF